jgi:hypothetical protein
MITLFYSLIAFLHPIHISVTEINYSAKDKALQITSRIFIDDLELAIRSKRKEENLDIINPKNGLTTDQMVSEYVKEHLQIKVDGKARPITYLGSEKEDLAIICYIEVQDFKKAKTIEVTNNVIMEIHDDQSNLVHITYNGPVKSARLVKDNPKEIFKFGK